MTSRLSTVLILLLWVYGVGRPEPGDRGPGTPPRTLAQQGDALTELARLSTRADSQYLILSFHRDGACSDTPRGDAAERDDKTISQALDLLARDPAYRFDLQDVLCLREYLERHPERRRAIHQLSRAGRFAIGASFTRPFEDLSSAEMLVRQFYSGRKWFRDNFRGCDTRTYWNPDVPGRTLQMPQILLRAGVPYLVMSRFARGLFRWRSPDGLDVLAFSPGPLPGFRDGTRGGGFADFASLVAATAVEWKNTVPSASSRIPIVAAADPGRPEILDELVFRWNLPVTARSDDGQPRGLILPPIRYSGMEQYLDAVSPLNRRLPGIRGERPNLWLYSHGPAHHRAISAKRQADHLLPAAEAFSTIDAQLNRSFQHYPGKELTAAWEAQLYPDHDWGSMAGSADDRKSEALYQKARDTGEALLEKALSSIAARVRSKPGKGQAVVAFNSLSWARSGPVECAVEFAASEVPGDLRVEDASGRPVPSQLLSVTRYSDGSLRSASILFIARDVPSFGYSTFYIRPAAGPTVSVERNTAEGEIDSDFYRVTLGPGGVRQILDKSLGRGLLDTGKFLAGELFTMRSAGECAGEWPELPPPGMEDFDRVGNHGPAWRIVESGPVRVVAELRQALDHARVSQRIVVFRSLRRVDFEADLLGWDGTPNREFRMAFPVAVSGGRVAYEVPFGVVEVGRDEIKGAPGAQYVREAATIRPRSIQNWISASDETIGVTLSSSVAVWDTADPTANPGGSPVLQPVLLASRRHCRGMGPWHLQSGHHHFRFSLASHLPGWRNGSRPGVEANSPLRAVLPGRARADASLPESRSFLSVDADNVVVTAFKKAEDDDSVVVRLFDIGAFDVVARLRLAFPVREATSTDLLEENDRPAETSGDGVVFFLGHHGIRTFKLRLKS